MGAWAWLVQCPCPPLRRCRCTLEVHTWSLFPLSHPVYYTFITPPEEGVCNSRRSNVFFTVSSVGAWLITISWKLVRIAKPHGPGGPSVLKTGTGTDGDSLRYARGSIRYGDFQQRCHFQGNTISLGMRARYCHSPTPTPNTTPSTYWRLFQPTIHHTFTAWNWTF